MLTLKLAVRNLLRNRRRTIFTGASMLGGYMLLVITMSLQDGSYDQVLRAYTQDTSGHLQLIQNRYLEKQTLYRTVDDYKQRMAELHQFEFVQSIAPRIHSAALAYGIDKSAPVQILGIDPELEAQTSFITNKIKQGNYFSDRPTAEGYYQAMLGHAAAKQLGLTVGDELVLISQGADGSLANDIFIISAIVGDPDSAERQTAYLPLNAVQQFLVMPNRVHRLVILTDDYLDAESNQQKILQQYQQLYQQQEVVLEPWQVVEKDFYRLMKADREGAVVMTYVYVFLVAIGLLNTVLMSILERTGEFGVLKAIGTSPKRIFWQIMLESSVLSVVSCVLGFIFVFPINWYFVKVGITLPEPVDVGGLQMQTMTGLLNVSVFSNPVFVITIASLVISIIPAFRAARIEPLQAMRRL